MGMGIFSSPPPPKPSQSEPPSVEQLFNGASAFTASATLTFRSAIEELEIANEDFDAVEMRTTSDIDRLVKLRQDAADQRRANLATIEKLRDLVGG